MTDATKPARKLNPTNQCGACFEDFASVELFKRHRVGTHDYTYDEGLGQSPPRIDGRRCLSASAMLEKGWAKDARDLWIDPRRVARARAAFGTR